MAGRGTRQGLAVKQCTHANQVEFKLDKTFRLFRIRFLTDDAIMKIGDLVRVEADGQVLFSGLNVPIVLIADPTDDATDSASPQGGAHVAVFDDPIEVSNDYSVRVTYTSADAVSTDALWIELESVPAKEAA